MNSTQKQQWLQVSMQLPADLQERYAILRLQAVLEFRRASVRVGTVQQQEKESSEAEEVLAGLLLRRGAEAWLLDAIHSGKQSPQDDQKGACNKTCQGQAERPAAHAGNG